MRASINTDHFKEYEIIEDGIPFNYLHHNYRIYIGRLKEIAADWDNAISEEWKQKKLLTKIDPKPERKTKSIVDYTQTSQTIMKKLITHLLIVTALGILWFVFFVIK